MTRNTRATLTVATLLVAWGAAAQSAAARRNVVMIVADDHGQDTGAYGNPVIQTPNLDALAADGVRFRHAYATTASCSASRSVILTGLHNHRTGQYGHTHDYAHFSSFDHIRSLPVLLAEAGYRTAIVGKFHVAPEPVYHFQEVLEADSRNPVAMAESARDFLTRSTDRPFFLYYATSDPHRGGGRDPGLPGSPDRFGNSPEARPGVEAVVYDPGDVIVPAWLPDTTASRAELAQYYQSVSRLDQGVGRLVALLKEAGAYADTLILYLSDHGAAFPGAKTTVYEPGLRSPLIVRHPDLERRGIVNDALVSWVDLTPTVLHYAGIEPPVYEQHIETPVLRPRLPATQGLHGRSFLPVLGEEAPAGWDEVYASHTFHEIQMYYPMRALRDRRYKLIWNIAWPLPFPFATDLWTASAWREAWQAGPTARYGQRSVDAYVHRAEFELYDLEQDPGETRNLATDPAFAETLADYQERLREFQRRTSDPWLLTESRIIQ